MGDICLDWRFAVFLPSAAAGFVVWFCFRRAASECYDAGYQAGVRSRDTPGAVSRIVSQLYGTDDDPTHVVWSVAVCSECGALKEAE